MSHLTALLDAANSGDRRAAADLLPLVYGELRKLAAARLAAVPPGQTLQATALVHEAYLRVVGQADQPRWESRGHFFAAAATAMRHILVDAARRKGRTKNGGGRTRIDLDDALLACPENSDDLLALDAALTLLAEQDPQAARLVELRHFSGLSMPEVAGVLDISPRTADRLWSFARAWLHNHLTHADAPS